MLVSSGALLRPNGTRLNLTSHSLNVNDLFRRQSKRSQIHCSRLGQSSDHIDRNINKVNCGKLEMHQCASGL